MARAHRLAAIVGLLLLAAGSRPSALEANLDMAAIDEAIVFARMAQRGARQAFHDAYLRYLTAPVRRVSIVSEYRRVVLRVEEHIRLGDRNYGVRQMTSELGPWRGQVEVIVELVFHPQNTYVGVPLIDVLLVPLDGPDHAMPIVADATDRIPRVGMFWDPPPPEAPWWPFPPPSTVVRPSGETVTGGWVLARFDAAAVAAGRYDVVVKEGAATLGTATFDFGALR